MISTLTVVAVILASVPSVLATKFVAEFIGAGDASRAARLFSGVVATTGIMGTLAAVVLAVLRRPVGAGAMAVYVPLFGLYLVFKGAYFAFGEERHYARAEALGALAFGIIFSIACLRRESPLATASLLAHPLVFALCAIMDHRSKFRAYGGLIELVQDWRQYGVYSIATFVNAMHGLGSYNLLVVLASLFLDTATLGYLNVILATLSPLSYISTAYGAVAFPEMSHRHGEGNADGLRSLLWRSTLILQVIGVLVSGAIVIAPDSILVLLHVPAQRGLVLALCWVAVSLQFNMTSAPSGHYLNATRHVVRHALFSGMFLVAGTIVGLTALSICGVVGAGIMRFAVDGSLSCVRMVVAVRALRWAEGRLTSIVAGQVGMLVLLAAAVLGVPWAVTGAIWVATLATQLPSLIEVARHWGRDSRMGMVGM